MQNDMEIKEISMQDIDKGIISLAKKAGVIFVADTVYMGCFLGDKLIGFVGYKEYKNKVVLRNGYVLRPYRGQGFYTIMCEERLRIVKELNKPIFVNVYKGNEHCHLKQGAVIVKEYKTAYQLEYK